MILRAFSGFRKHSYTVTLVLTALFLLVSCQNKTDTTKTLTVHRAKVVSLAMLAKDDAFQNFVLDFEARKATRLEVIVNASVNYGTYIKPHQEVQNSLEDKFELVSAPIVFAVTFDTKLLTYQDSSSVITYTKLYSVSGMSPGSAVPSEMYVLANEEYTYDQIDKSNYSSQSSDQIDFRIIATN